jgi:hypothetical protein
MTNHKHAQAAFGEKLNATDPKANPQEWNLASGLLSQSYGIEEDLTEIKGLLRQILQELQRRP